MNIDTVNKLTDLLLTKEEIDFFGFNNKLIHTRNNSDNNNIVNIYTIDCEYVETENGTSELACVTIIDWNKNIILNELIKPQNIIVDYITHITGFTEKTFYDVIITKEIVRELILSIIKPNDIICGHHVYNDLTVIGIFHERIIDTAILYNHPDGPPNYYSLKYLASFHLNRIIQESVHNSLEDCVTTRDLINSFVEKNYIRTTWKNIGQIINNPDKFIIFNAIKETIKCVITNDNVLCIYTRGSRAISTNRETSDWDFVVVVDDSIVVQENALIKYGNMDIVLYTESYFTQLLCEQVIWAHECIYAPTNKILKEEINFKEYMKKYYEKTDRNVWIPFLRGSVGMQSSRKLGSSKRFHKLNLIHNAKKHMFIGIRFIMYGIDIINHKKIPDIAAYNHIWHDMIKLSEFDYAKYEDIFEDKYEIFKLIALKSARHGGFRYRYDKNTKHLIKSPKTINIVNDNNKTIFVDSEQKIIATTFNNIYDFTNSEAVNSINLSNALVQNKIDGTLCIMYHYDGKWHVAGNRDPFGNNYLGKRNNQEELVTQKDLFWSIWKSKNYDITRADPAITYMFEMISPKHINIIRYTFNPEDLGDIILIGAKNRETLYEFDIQTIKKITGWDITLPESYKYNPEISFNDFVDSVIKSKDNIEGVIVMDNNFNRIKICKDNIATNK
jgi:DNA polymerase III epsilon subunit-like protein